MSSLRIFAFAFIIAAAACAATAGAVLPLPANVSTLVTTTPQNWNSPLYTPTAPSAYDSIARLLISTSGGNFGCSGSLIAGTSDILTAAHCISGTNGQLDVSALTATFFTAGGQLSFSGQSYFLAPGWTGNFLQGSDLAVVRLAGDVPLPGYGLWTGPDPFGQTFALAGYGRIGTGLTGDTGNWGTLHAGQNYLDPVVWNIPGLPYAWDFDDGSAAHDALNFLVGASQTGVGPTESLIAPGDSGGPLLFGGMILGVHSFGATYGLAGGDIDGLLNSTFGELAGDTRVNFYTPWINSVETETQVPEPASIILFGPALALLARFSRRRSRRS